MRYLTPIIVATATTIIAGAALAGEADVVGVRIPADMPKVRVSAHDKVHGYGGAEMEIDMKTGGARPAGGQS